VIKIAQKTSSSARALQNRQDAAAGARTPNLGIDPPSFLAAMLPLPPKPESPCADIERGVVSLINQRGRVTHRRTRLTKAERESQTTFARAAALDAHKAESAEEIEAAHRLVHRRYSWRGYDVPAPDDRSGGAPGEASRCEITFVATDEVDTVGTITLGLDSNDGLLAERTHGDAVAQRRAAGRSVCELTRLAVAERADSKSVLAALFNVAYVTGSKHGVTDVFIEVNPRHVSFYTRVLGFAVAAAEKFCERVSAPSVLLSLAIDELERRLIDLDLAIAPRSYSARAA
jgi:hypothetical protein